MQKLNLPKYPLRLREKEERKEIYDIIRRRYYVLTPEEWVRQHIVHYFIHEKKVPKSLISVERSLRVNGLLKRTDVVIYARGTAKPLMIIECKAPQIKVSENVFHQAVRYNMTLNASYLYMTNGLDHYCCKVDYQTNKLIFIKDIPEFDAM
ncbi:MAG: type I restriction enzyme HsdR N-terminal domain-containing protein [Bacteroidales bacterium]|nr:type I restriction enzyme HsdR N-terminal domain-containing protein [Bacteroidales bacterium]